MVVMHYHFREDKTTEYNSNFEVMFSERMNE